jgi:hypothetical protein
MVRGGGALLRGGGGEEAINEAHGGIAEAQGG